MVPGNARRGRPQGQCHRKQTAHLRACALRWVRVKRCGKSAPRFWQQKWQGKPHQEQRQIGVADGLFPARHPGRRREASGNGRPRGMVIHLRQRRGQNPAYRPSGSILSWRIDTPDLELLNALTTRGSNTFRLYSNNELGVSNYEVDRYPQCKHSVNH